MGTVGYTLNTVKKAFDQMALENHKVYGEPEDLANQRYFREKILEAYWLLYNHEPLRLGDNFKAESLFVSSSSFLFGQLVNSNRRNINIVSAAKACNILGEEFEPPESFVLEYCHVKLIRSLPVEEYLFKLVLKHFHALAEKNMKRQGKYTREFALKQRKYREIVFRAIVKHFDYIPVNKREIRNLPNFLDRKSSLFLCQEILHTSATIPGISSETFKLASGYLGKKLLDEI